MRVTKRKRHRWKWVAGLFLLGFIIDFAYFMSQIRWSDATYRFTIPSADVIAVLTGGPQRLADGIELLKIRKAPFLLISGIEKESSLGSILAANRIGDIDIDLRDRIFLDSVSQSTRDNADQIVQFLMERQLSSVIVVSAGFHFPRIQHLLGRSMIAMNYPLTVYWVGVRSNRFEGRWWFRWTSIDLVGREYAKWVAQRVISLFTSG